MSGIADTMRELQQQDVERQVRQFIEAARNAMRAVKIAIEDGDEEEALRLIDEALGDSA